MAAYIGFDLFRLADYAANLFIKELEAKGITDIRAAHISVFRELEEEGSRVADMALRANMTKQSMSALVDYLEDAGYVGRVPDLSDKRAKLVVLTEQGRAIYSFGVETGEAIERGWRAKLGEEDFEQFRQLLKRLSADTSA